VRADFRHRALRHHKQGVILAKQVFGECINDVPIELIGEQHNTEDFQYNPDASDWYDLITLEDWMKKNVPHEVIEKILIRKFGGEIGDYQFLIDFFNQFNTKDPRSKYILNHSWGIFDAESVFGVVFVRKSDQKEMPTRTICETVISMNYGKIPTPSDWISSIIESKWMYDKALALSQDSSLV
jgi:hypothetical protein